MANFSNRRAVSRKDRSLSVFILGATDAAYRPGLWLKYFADRPERYQLSSLSDKLYANRGRWTAKLGRLILAIIQCSLCDILIILPMTHGSRYATLCLQIAKWLKKRVICDVYISYFETCCIDRKLYPAESREGRQYKRADLACITGAKPAIFLTSAERNYYTSVVGLDEARIESRVVPLVVPERPEAVLPYLRNPTKGGIPSIAWWGRVGNPLHGFDNIAEAIRILIADDRAIRFGIFAANDSNYSAFRATYRDLASHPNVLFTCDYSFNNGRLTEYLVSETDLALGTFGPSRKARTVLVNKILDAASFGLPCLTQESEGMLEFFKIDETVLLSTLEPEAIAQSVKQALSDPDRLLRIGKAARRLSVAKFGQDSFSDALSAILH